MTNETIEQLKPGIYHGIPFDTYASWDAVNMSFLKNFERSAAHARSYKTRPPQPTKSQIIGQASHVAILEPARFEVDYVKAPVLDRRTKAGKDAWAQFEADHALAITLTVDEYDLCCAMRDAVTAHPTANTILRGKGQNEISIVWTDAETGLLCKGRIDRVTTWDGWTTIVDLKTTKDGSPKGFPREIARYDYQSQLAWYADALDTLAQAIRRKVIVAVENDPDDYIGVCCYELDMDDIAAGRRLYRGWLRQCAEAKKTNNWSGYPTGLVHLTLPPWARQQTIDE